MFLTSFNALNATPLQEGSFCKMVKSAFALFLVFAVLFFLALAVLGPAMAALTVLGFLFLISFARFQLKG